MIARVENFFTRPALVTRNCQTTARQLGNAPIAKQNMQSHFMPAPQFQGHVRKPQLHLPLVFLNLMMINLRPMNLTMHKNLIMTVKRKVLMTSRLLWLQLVNLKDIVH